jgi:hypothetical protein
MHCTIRGVDYGPRLTLGPRYRFECRIEPIFVLVRFEGAGRFAEFIDLRFLDHAH